LIFEALGVAIAFIRGYIQEIKDRTIRSVDDIGYIGLPVLGSVPTFGSKPLKKGKRSYQEYSYSERLKKDAKYEKEYEKKNEKK
jgi:hypothetical protein